MKVATYAMKGVSIYKELYPALRDEYVVAVDDNVEYGYYVQMAQEKKIQSISCLPCDDVIISRGYNKTKGKYATADKNGVFHIQLKNKANIIIMRWITYSGGSRRYEAVRVGVEKDLIDLERILTKTKKQHQKPALGVYRCENDSHGNIWYEKKSDKEYPDTTVVHPLLSDIEHHISYYFSNVSAYMVNNRAGRKTILLHGQQGTGKSSIAYRIARKYASQMSVTFVTNTYCLYNHVENCAKYSVPTIVIFEDCEGSLSSGNGAIKNFLSGIDARQNKAGCYIIMTTNYPGKIEQTILLRKGRIDKLFMVGKLTGDSVIQCVDIYFAGAVTPKEMVGIKQYLGGKSLSGSEIEVLAQECLTLAAKDGRDKVTCQDVRDAYAEMLKEMEDIEYDDDVYKMDDENVRTRMGFAVNVHQLEETI